MSRSLWRIAADTKEYEAHDLSGAGAKKSGGRWNEVGLPTLYASESRGLACLETIVHLNAGGLPLNRYLVEIAVPDDVWSSAHVASVPWLDVGWDAEPAGRASIAFGSRWLRGKGSLLLIVPSVIVPEENNILVNPDHAALHRLQARKIRKWLYDPRLVRSA